jgi:hypothetical protein
VSISAITGTGLTVSWNKSTDNIGISEYEIFRNGVFAGKTKLTIFKLTGLNTNQIVSIAVRAKDTSGNKSALSITVKTAQTVKLYANGSFVNFKQLSFTNGVKPTAFKGTTMVPYKPLLETMGYTVKYDSKTKTLIASKGTYNIKFISDKTVALINGKTKKTMTVAPTVMKNTFMLPINFVSSEFGYKIVTK